MTDRLRPEWAAPRKETWYEHLLPQRVTDTINQSPLVGALSKYMSSPPPDLTLPSERDSKVPMPRSPSWFDDRPIATDALDKFGLLANFFGPGAKLPPPAPKPTGIRAYHGSPHDFDKFDMSKIGTGEGAQAYGRGLYFAESEGVAKSYRDNLIPTRDAMAGVVVADGKPTGYPNIDVMLAKLYGGDWEAFKRGQSGISKPLDAAIADIDRRGGIAPYQPATGRMYEVKINADPETFLDWDKPLGQQSEAARRALREINLSDKYDAVTVADALGAVGEKTASRLRDAGIPGIKYLDQGSRTAGQGSRNYVVFDDKLIEILRKYGLLPPVAAGAASLAQGQEPPL